MGTPKKVIEAQTERDVHLREITRVQEQRDYYRHMLELIEETPPVEAHALAREALKFRDGGAK